MTEKTTAANQVSPADVLVSHATTEPSTPIWLVSETEPLSSVEGLSDDARRWLAQYGDPYDVIVADLPGNVAIDFGVTGAPETFLVDAQGVIRYKYVSPITPQVIATELLPRIAALKEATR